MAIFSKKESRYIWVLEVYIVSLFTWVLLTITHGICHTKYRNKTHVRPKIYIPLLRLPYRLPHFFVFFKEVVAPFILK